MSAADWKHEDRIRLGRNFLRAGDPCRVKGLRGSYTFRELVTNANGETWAEVTGAPVGRPIATRAVNVDRLVRKQRPKAEVMRVQGTCECHGVLQTGEVIRKYKAFDILDGSSMVCYAVRVVHNGVTQRMLCDIEVKKAKVLEK